MEQSVHVYMLIAWVGVGRFLQNVNTLNICAFGEFLMAGILNYILQLFRVKSMYQNIMCLDYSFSKVSLLILIFCCFYHTKYISYCLEKMNLIILMCVCVCFLIQLFLLHCKSKPCMHHCVTGRVSCLLGIKTFIIIIHS